MHIARLFAVAALSLPFLSPASLGARVITFDDISSEPHFATVPNGYSGFDWAGIWYQHYDEYPGSGYQAGTVSSPYTAFGIGGSQIRSSTAQPFTASSMYLAAAWNNDLNVTVNGYSGDALLYTMTFVVGPFAPTFASLEFAGIDRLTFETAGGTDAGLGGGGRWFAIDDIRIDESAVPEPSTTALVGGGLILAFWIRRSRLI